MSVYESIPESQWHRQYETREYLITESVVMQIFAQKYEPMVRNLYIWFLKRQKLPMVRVIFDYKVTGTEHGFFCARDNAIVINVRSIFAGHDFRTWTFELLGTMLHELFHYWQATVEGGIARLEAHNLLFNGGDFSLYWQNPIEVEARSFTQTALEEYLGSFGTSWGKEYNLEPGN